jgi:hypothetical protein
MTACNLAGKTAFKWKTAHLLAKLDTNGKLWAD